MDRKSVVKEKSEIIGVDRTIKKKNTEKEQQVEKTNTTEKNNRPDLTKKTKTYKQKTTK